MKKSILKPLSIIALICSIFPAMSYLLAMFSIDLSSGIQRVLVGVNIMCVILGLGLSGVCIRSNGIRNIINIVSIIISIFWLLLIVGLLIFALFLSYAR